MQTYSDSKKNNDALTSAKKADTEATAKLERHLELDKKLTQTTLELVELQKELLKTTT